MNKILYNVTVSIDPDIEQEWLEWMKNVHIPEVMETGFFLSNRICRIHAFEQGGLSYAIQYIARSMDDYNAYQENFAARLQSEHTKKYQGKFEAFRTLLEIVHEIDATLPDISAN
jgi:hypothetical protein